MTSKFPGLGGLIRSERQHILSAWESAVRALPVTAPLDRPALVDHIPQILDRIAEMADGLAQGTLPPALIEAHALERLQEGFGLRHVVRELGVLRDCIVDACDAQPVREIRAAMRAIDETIAVSVERFTQLRDETLLALDRIATEAFESRSLDELLQRLLAVFVESCTAADTASIQIRDGDSLRVRASLGAEVATESAIGIRALYGAPLICDGEAIGVAQMGSRTANEFPARDRHLFAAMAARASSAIFQQMLKERAEHVATELAATAREQRLLARAAIALTADLDTPLTLAHLAEQVVPELADWCVVDVLAEGKLERVAIAHSDRTKVALAREWSARFPPEPRRPTSIAYVMRTGSPLLVREVNNIELLQSHGSREYLDMLRELGIGSVIVAPLAVRGRTLGTLTLVRAAPGGYGERELATAVEIGRRAGMGLDNARLYTEAQDALYSRDRMLAIVSHELRSPLASIELAATLAREAQTLDPRVLKHLDVVQRSADQMERLLGDLIDTASLQVGRFRVDKRREDISRLVNDAVAVHEAQAIYRSIRIERDTHLTGASAQVDRTRMIHALGNVIGNAIKFCKAGDVIFIKGRVEGDQIHLIIEDTGPGIQDRDLPYVFEAYWSARRIAVKGSGLGLYICKGIIEAHGGTIVVESKLGQGTAFSIVLPLDA